MKVTQLALFPESAVTGPRQPDHAAGNSHTAPCRECLDYMPSRSPFDNVDELPFEQDGDDQ